MFSSNTTQTSGGYEIQRSLRFNQADDTYLNRTPAGAGNRTTWTWSAWVKRSNLSDFQYTVFAAGSGSNYDEFRFNTSDQFRFFIVSGGSVVLDLLTTQVFRDPSAWYHFVVTYDSTQATASNRAKLYANGVQITTLSTATYPSQNTNSSINNNVEQRIGLSSSGFEYNGYMTEVNFIDGQALTPSSFGEYNADTGVWQPKRYAGSYGTNGFYLNFSNNSNTTAATLGADYSGNGNNWTPNNFSVSAGAGNDSLVDVPTNWGVDTGVGGTVRGNYATCNPLLGSTVTLSNGNLDIVVGTSATKVLATIGMSSGKWYWEYSYTDLSGDGSCGIATSQTTIAAHVGTDAFSWGYFAGTGNKVTNATSTSYGASYTTGNVIGVAFDADAGTLVFYKNGTSQGTAFSSLTSGPYFPAFGDNAAGSSSSLNTNFGQRPFAYTAPSGFKALNTQNLPTPTIGATPATQAGKFFNPVLYTGTGSARSITGVGFQPDWVWTKERGSPYNHGLFDSVRGATKGLVSNTTSAEYTDSQSLTSFNSDGFSLGTAAGENISGETYVAWNWKANGAGVTNTAGSITSTVSANTTSGFSVVTYTGSGADSSIGHGLGSAPKMIIAKRRDGTGNWMVQHASLGSNYYGLLNAIDAFSSNGSIWYSSPTSSVFYVGTNVTVNTSGATNVAYCFSEVPGYSKFGSYTGNGSTDGPFVFCGFRPAYIMVKRTDNTGEWGIHDSDRDPNNVVSKVLLAESSGAELDGFIFYDFVSNGFKLRNSNANRNASGGTYIFMAFAEAPQKFSLAR